MPGDDGPVAHRPADSMASPRFTGPRTFMRLPHVQALDGVDAAVIGIPADGAVGYRSGARFGPEAIRSASVLLRPYDPELDADLGRLSLVDYGDAPTVPGYQLETLERVAAFLRPVTEAGVVPLCMGGDHSMTLAELRAAAGVHGALALVHLDAHSDVLDSYFGVRHFHGTVFRRAVEEGLVDARHSIQAGMRGTIPAAAERDAARELGFDVVTWAELERLEPAAFGERARRRAGGRPAFLSFDIDFVDPAFAPGTGTPEVGGPTSHQALAYVGALTGVDFRAFDVVEVAPPYDPAGITALLAAAVCHRMLSLLALTRREEGH